MKYKIVDIHSDDACSDIKEIFIGKTGNGFTHPSGVDGWLAGGLDLDEPIIIDGTKTSYMYFCAVKLELVGENR